MANIHFIYDVMLNWADGINKAYLIPQYHEWYKEDEIELFTFMPVVLVSEDLFTDIEQNYNPIPDELLALVARKATQDIDGMKVPVNYAFVVTDGQRMLAVDTDDEELPNFKSHLTPISANHVHDLLWKLTPLKTKWVKPEPKKLSKKDQFAAEMLLLDEQYVTGLTRAEKDMKTIIMTYIYTLSTSTNLEEVRYFYSEVFPGTYNDEKVKRMKKETLVRKMFDELKEGWDERHIRLGDEFIKSNTLFKTSWQLLRKRKKEKVKN